MSLCASSGGYISMVVSGKLRVSLPDSRALLYMSSEAQRGSWRARSVCLSVCLRNHNYVFENGLILCLAFCQMNINVWIIIVQNMFILSVLTATRDHHTISALL